MPAQHVITTPTQRVGQLAAMILLACSLCLALGVAQAGAATYEGLPALVAIQGQEGYLWTYKTPAYSGESGTWKNTGKGLAAGTSPSVAKGEGENYGIAFHALGTNHLWIYPTLGLPVETIWGLAPSTSPSIVRIPGGFEVAFHAEGTNHLWTYSSASGIGVDTGKGLAAGTSPSIARGAGETYAVAFHAEGTNHLWIYPSQGSPVETIWGLAPGTSPSITGIPGGFEVAFHAEGTNDLWVYSSVTGIGTDTGLGMASGTSPAITSFAGSYKVLFQALGINDLYLYSPSTGGTNLGFGMAPGTSPTITKRFPEESYWMGAFQANTGVMWTYSSSGGGASSGGLMKAGTSPSTAGGL